MGLKENEHYIVDDYVFSIEVMAEGGSFFVFEFAYSIYDRFAEPISEPDEHFNSLDGNLLEVYIIGDTVVPTTGSMQIDTPDTVISGIRLCKESHNATEISGLQFMSTKWLAGERIVHSFEGSEAICNE